MSQQALYRIRQNAGTAAVADRAGDGRDLPEAAAHAEVVGIDKFAILFDLLAFDADIGNPVLSATVGAAGYVQLDLLVEARQSFVKFARKPARETFRFSERKLAEFRARAGDRAAGESPDLDRQACRGQFRRDGFAVLFADVGQQHVLLSGEAEAAVAVLIGELGDLAELRRSDPSAQNGSANKHQSGLLLTMNSGVVAVGIRRNFFVFGRVQAVADDALQFGEKPFGGPVKFEEKILQTGIVAADAQNIARAEDFGDAAGDVDDLILADEGVELQSEVRLGREAASDS